MAAIRLSVLFLFLFLASLSGAPPAFSGEALDRYIVVLSDDVPDGEVEGAAADLASRHEAVPEHLYKRALKGFSARIPRHKLSALKSDYRVNNVVEDKLVYAFCHTDPFQTLPTGIDRIDTDLSPTAKIDGVNGPMDVGIAILDTGIYPHQDLNVLRSVDCTQKRGCKTVSASDRDGHGTSVAGVAAARDNDRAVVGVAPGARLWSVQVLGTNGVGRNSWIIAGIDYVTQNAVSIQVANMSLGGDGTDTGNCGVDESGRVVDPLHKAICNSVAHGVTYVAAAGNESQDAANITPAAYPEVISVGALADYDSMPGGLASTPSGFEDDGADDTYATFSNFGKVDLVAPGVDLLSTAPGSRKARQGMCFEGLGGTSYSAPHVAGAAALYIRRQLDDQLEAGNPNPTRPSPSEVRDALRAAGQCPDGSPFGTGPCPTGWPGDPDCTPEENPRPECRTKPLVYVGDF